MDLGQKLKFSVLFLQLLAVASASAQAPLSLSKSLSALNFDVRSRIVAVQGHFTDYVGRAVGMETDPAGGEFAFKMDLAQIDFDSDNPQGEMIARGIIESLPNSMVEFRSQKITKVGPGEFRAAGFLRNGGRSAKIELPFFVKKVNERTIELSGSISEAAEDHEQDLPPAVLALGEVRGTVRFKLRFGG